MLLEMDRCSDVALLRMSSCTVDAVAVQNFHKELTLSFGAKLIRPRGGCSGQYKGIVYCLAGELVFRWVFFFFFGNVV
jgi:hypothetical protein